ncbi:hypothetical protein B6U91_02080 [Candidatus Pacearchaeota archaeon ex4484_71]|nr:MAG: hypothetical protein B6U91_02080 [Candidatus Pacearchaeota archaeon ex4484_71]
MKKREGTLALLLILLIFFASTSFARNISKRQIDDVSPEIFCEKEYLQKADILWVIPEYNNSPISKHKEWCKEIVSLNKTIGMHGLNHNYREFNYHITDEQLMKGVSEFEECFNQTPKMFKPPQLKISKENRQMIKRHNLELKRFSNQFFHKVYHCSDTGTLPNKFHDIF